MAVTRGNLISGPAISVTIGGTNIGGTLGPVGFRKEVIHQEDRADQREGILVKKEDDVRYYIIIPMAEVSLANMRVALNQASANLVGSTLTLDEDVNGEVAVVFTGNKNSTGGTRTFTYSICVLHSIEPVLYGRQQQQALNVEFEVLQNASDGSWGTVVDS